MAGALFLQPRPLNTGLIGEFAMSTGDYIHLGSLLTVSVVHSECFALSRHLPIAFARHGSHVVLQAVLGLRPGRTLFCALPDPPHTATPLLLQAYPIGLGCADGAGAPHLVLDTAPAKPMARRTPLLACDGSLAPHLVQKIAALQLYADAEPATRRMLDALDAAAAFGPWRLRLRFADGTADIADLLTITPKFCNDPRYRSLVATFGPALVNLVEYHLLSRARIAWLAALDGWFGQNPVETVQ